MYADVRVVDDEFQKGGNPYFRRRPVEDRDRHFMREVYVRPGGDAFRRQQRRFENAYVRHFRRYSAAYFPLRCVITARNLEPTNASRNSLQIESNPGRQHQLYLYGDRSGTADRRFPEFEGSWRRIGDYREPDLQNRVCRACADARIDQRTPFRLSAKLRGIRHRSGGADNLLYVRRSRSRGRISCCFIRRAWLRRT